MYRFSDNLIIQTNEDKVILGNGQNGKWIRISKLEYENLGRVLQRETIDGTYKKKVEILQEAGIVIENGKEGIVKDKLETIMIAITNRCNLKCVHCGFSAGPGEKEQLSFGDIKKIIDANRKIENITITGGEPLIHPEFIDIANYLGKYFPGSKGLMTNATLINKDNIDLIVKNFDDISISIDAASEETCDYMRGKGVFEHTVNVINMLKEKGPLDISLSFVITDVNKGEQDEFLKMCESLGIKPILRKLFSVGRGKDNEEILELKNVSDTIYEVGIESAAEIRKNMQIKNRCGAGRKSVYIQYDGNIYPCPVAAINQEFIMKQLWDLGTMDLQSLVDGRADCRGYCRFRSIMPEGLEHCSDCNVRNFCWGCAQDYYTYLCDEELRMEFCTKQKEILEEVIWGD